MPTTFAAHAAPLARADTARGIFGRVLRESRDASGTSRAQAGTHVCASPSKISRIERGQVAVKPHDLDELLTLYGLTDGERQPLMELSQRLSERQWWHDHGNLEGWFCSYLAFESVAQFIRTYEVRFIPGLLQTRSYAEAVMRARYHDDVDVQRRVDVRMKRQRMLVKGSTRLWAVIDEAALSEKVCSTPVMRDQIQHLIKVARHPNVHLQILNTGEGSLAGVGTSFSMLRLRISKLPDVVYLEHLDSALFLSNPDESDPYDIAFTKLSIRATEPADTTGKLHRALRRIGGPA